MITPHIFATSSYGANGLSAAASCSAIAILLLGVAIVSSARRTSGGVVFGITAASSSAWLISFALMYAAHVDVVALFWARVGSVAVSFIAPAMYHFAAIYSGQARHRRGRITLFWSLCGAFGLGSLVPVFVPTVHHYVWGFYPESTFASGLAIGVYIVVVASGVAMLRDSYATAEGKLRERAGALIVAYSVVGLAAIDYLPSVGVDLVPIGHIVLLAFVMISATAVWRFRLVDLTPSFAAGQILETMKSAVLVVDMAGQIQVVNEAACSMLGYDASELVGMPIRRVLVDISETTSGQILKSSGVIEQTTVWRTADGKSVDVLASSSFVRDDRGSPLAAVYVASDYTDLKRAEQAIRVSEQRYRTLFECNPLPMWIYDQETLRFTDVNDAAVARYGYTREQFLAMTIAALRDPQDIDDTKARIARLRGRQGPNLVLHRTREGSVLEAEITSFEFEENGRRARLVIAQDVTERRRSEEELRRSEERYRLLFERNLAGVFRSRIDGQIIDANDAMARLFGFASREELLRSPAISLYYDAADRARIMQMLREQKALSGVEVKMRRTDGAPLWVIENVTLLEGGDVLEGTLVDITDRKIAQERVEYQAYHDELTGLPNRQLFRDRLTVAMAHAHRHSGCIAVMFLDLDQFKLVNDTLGHTVGDRLLQVVAARIVGCMRAEDTVARLGGDEFIVLLGEMADRRAAASVAQKIIDAIRQPFEVDGHELFVTSSIGISIYPEDGVDVETLLKNADRAMYRAKDFGRNNYQYATPDAFETAEGRLALERSLHHALERDEFVVYYQPIIEIATGRVVAAEALLRWRHPENGLLPPEAFIGVAEECNLIVPLGEWVLRTACRQMKKWHDDGHLPLRVAVNLSIRQLQHRDLITSVERILDETGLPPAALDVEVTESAAMQNVDGTATVLRALKAAGVRISMDDFGKGYSSLSYLKRLPIDTVKIDQEFVRDLAHDTSDAAIISAVISIARALQLDVVAEGVETSQQFEFLQRENCQFVQGFLHSAPVSADDFERLILTGGVTPPADAPRLRPLG